MKMKKKNNLYWSSVHLVWPGRVEPAGGGRQLRPSWMATRQPGEISRLPRVNRPVDYLILVAL